MKSWFLIGFILMSFMGVMGFQGKAMSQEGHVLQETVAFKKFENRAHSELSELMYILDWFRESQFTIVYDGVEHENSESIRFSRKYLAENYKDEDAAKWLKKHCYRSAHKGDIIYLKTDTGDLKPMRDVALEELSKLEKVMTAG